MKFTVTLKDPDALHECLREADMGVPDSLGKGEREVVTELRVEKAREFAGQWMEYGEYITVEFDTEAGTCVVQKRDGR